MDSRIQSYLRFAASQQRDTQQIGPFLATFNRHSANPFLNYAIPDDAATPSLTDVNALIAAYESRGRKPRLEYVATLAPAVEEAFLHPCWILYNRRNFAHFAFTVVSTSVLK